MNSFANLRSHQWLVLEMYTLVLTFDRKHTGKSFFFLNQLAFKNVNEVRSVSLSL